MPAKTLRERLIIALEARGCVEVDGKRTHLSVVFTYPGKEDQFIYIGSAGSFRVGRTKASSIPFDRLKDKLLQECKG